jgi:hypothetical protein
MPPPPNCAPARSPRTRRSTRGLADAAHAASQWRWPRAVRALSSPALRARQTAEALGFAAAIAHALGTPPDAMLRLDIAPLTRIELKRAPRGWVLRLDASGSA